MPDKFSVEYFDTVELVAVVDNWSLVLEIPLAVYSI